MWVQTGGVSLEDTEGVLLKCGEIYYRPFGWMLLGLNVARRYGADKSWMKPSKKRWPVSYHGVDAANVASIIRDGYRIDLSRRDVYGQLWQQVLTPTHSHPLSLHHFQIAQPCHPRWVCPRPSTPRPSQALQPTTPSHSPSTDVATRSSWPTPSSPTVWRESITASTGDTPIRHPSDPSDSAYKPSADPTSSYRASRTRTYYCPSACFRTL